MRYHHCIFIVFTLLFYSCVNNKRRLPITVKDRGDSAINNGIVEIPIYKTDADFSTAGLENLNASHNMKNIICQCWDYKEDMTADKGQGNSSAAEPVYRGFCFFEDGTMIKDPRGYLQTGTWTLNENERPIKISVKMDNGRQEAYKLAYLMPYELILASFYNNEKTLTDMSSEALRHVELGKDPFYQTNTWWMKSPKKMETEEEIKQRLKACIHFFVLFYREKIDAHSETVSFTGLPSCFNWYAGGIYLQNKISIQQKWINCFYNREQAMTAYGFARKLLSHGYTWPQKETNWLKQNVYVLKQMENRTDSL